MPQGLDIRASHKLIILGDYEQGKSTLAKTIMASMPRYMAWDPRQDVFERGNRDFTAFTRQFTTEGRAIYAPGRGGLPAKLDNYCEFALTQHNAMVFIEEPAMVGKANLPESVDDLHRLGHARSLGVTVTTHSLWDLPHVYHQANHWFVFRTTRPIELNALGQVLNPKALDWLPKAPPYWCWHRGGGHEGPMKPVGVTHGKPPPPLPPMRPIPDPPPMGETRPPMGPPPNPVP